MAHYNSFIRIPALVIRNRIAPLPRLDAFETDVIRLRVWPNDIDFNLHLNNARYLSVMDYGRMRLLARIGLLTPVLKAHWVPLVGGVWITYRRSLALWASYTLATRLVCWDERWFYMEQIFTGKDGLAAVGWVKGALHDPVNRVVVEPQRILDMVQPGLGSPPIPESILALNELTREKLQSISPA